MESKQPNPPTESAELFSLLIGAARAYLNQGDIDEAYRYTLRTLDLTDSDLRTADRIEALTMRGTLEAQKDLHAEALESWKKTLELQKSENDHTGCALTLCSMGEALQQLGNLNEAREALQESLRYSAGLPPGHERARALENLGTIQRVTGDLEASLHSLTEALRIREALEDASGLARTLNRLGNVYHNIGHLPEALEQYQRALKITESLGERERSAAILNNLAILARREGDNAQAGKHLREARKIFEQTGDRRRLADVLSNLGYIALDEANLADSEAHHKESLGIYRELNDDAAAANCLINLSHLALAAGRYAEAKDLAVQAKTTLTEGGRVENLDKALYFIFQSLLATDSLEEAGRIAKEVESLGGQTGSLEVLAEADLLKATYAFRRGEPAEALAQSRSAEKRAKEGGQSLLQGEALRLQGNVLLQQGELAAAREALLAAEKAHKTMGSPDLLALSRLTLGRLFLRVGAREAAAQRLRAAAGVFQRLENKPLEWSSLLTLAEVEWPLSRQQARATLDNALSLAQDLERPDLLQKTQGLLEHLESLSTDASSASSDLALLLELRERLKEIADPVSALDGGVQFLVEKLELSFGMGELADERRTRIGPHPPLERIPGELRSLLERVGQNLQPEFQWLDPDGDASFLAVFPVIGLSPTLMGFLMVSGRHRGRDAPGLNDPPASWHVLSAAAAILGMAMEIVSRDASEALAVPPSENPAFESIVGQSPPMVQMFETIRRISPTEATVLILGESGTGKELVARAIHNTSRRQKKPFVAISCPSIPRELIEAELFGHEKGAYTGAHQARPGQIELADGGTLFLDELGDMDHATQSKLLRFLQEREFQRVGGRSSIRVNVRVIAATSRDLEEEVRAGRFRKDLYYRLSVVPLRLPPLRARTEDIPLLVHHYLKSCAESQKRPQPQVTKRAMELLSHYPWPGNVRELRNVMEFLVTMGTSDQIRLEDLPSKIVSVASEVGSATSDAATDDDFPLPEGETLEARLMSVEGKLIREALDACGGNQSRAAKRLGLKEATLRYRMKRYGITSKRS